MKTRLLLAIAGAALAAAALASPAGALEPGDYGPPPGPDEIDCDGHGIDPPVPVVVSVEVTIDGTAYPVQTVEYGGTTPGIAHFDWTADQQAALDVPGPHEVQRVYTWTIGSGATVLLDSLTCQEPCEFDPALPADSEACVPPTTTTTPPPTTEAPPTTTAVVPPPAPTSPPQIGTPVSACPEGSEDPACLPHTGSTTAPLALAGSGILAAGGAIAGLTRTRRTA